MVIPADPEEMQHFQSQCVSQCVVDVFLPLAYIFLPSKQAFQSVYNRSVSLSLSARLLICLHRFTSLFFCPFPSSSAVPFRPCRINNDLLMWEAPPPSDPKSNHSPQHRRQDNDYFHLCKSAFKLGETPILRLVNHFKLVRQNWVISV